MKNSDTVARLRSLVERIARLEEDKKAIADDIKEIYGEAKSAGFDRKTLAQMVKEHLDPKEVARRIEHEALCELYRASLGNLNGTPLGEAARKRFEQPDEPPADADAAPPEPSAAPQGEITAEEIEAARQRGSADRKGSKRLIDNPFIAGDPRRAAWDEGWCMEAGSDGMDIPDALKRRKPKKDAPAPTDEDAGDDK